MTRINLVDPTELSQKMLGAEYREITRLPGNLYQSLVEFAPLGASDKVTKNR